ncbi:hypothetical protein LIER_42653 [Lithospermum erythrorhizon]|uniref:PIN-like protein n=1 Tax=Lithospermum erythrorhizon TaxID=34254 RepID=A0AAV3NU21_LITER
MSEKIYSTLRTCNVHLKNVCRERFCKTYCEFIIFLVLAEQNNEIVLKNNEACACGSSPFLEKLWVVMLSFAMGTFLKRMTFVIVSSKIKIMVIALFVGIIVNVAIIVAKTVDVDREIGIAMTLPKTFIPISSVTLVIT